jgi:hypothetical protein
MSAPLALRPSAVAIRWIQQWPPEGEAAFRIGRCGDELFADWPGLATLHAARSGDWSELVPAPGADPRLIGKFHSGFVRALLGHLRGKLTLHASAVLIDGAAVVLLGESGSGKSTTAADLCANSGASLLADDTATIDHGDGVVVTPNEETSWLTAEAFAAVGGVGIEGRKSPWEPRSRAADAAPLAAMIELVFDREISAPTIARVGGHDAFTTLSQAMVRFVLDEPALVLADFEQLATLAERVPLYLLRRPPQWTQLQAARDAIHLVVREANGRGFTRAGETA